MAREVTFKCEAPQSVGDADISVEGEKEPLRSLHLVDGDRTILLDDGRYELDIRAIGTPGTRFALSVTSGGKMRAIDVLLPTEKSVGKKDAGRDAFQRLLTVQDAQEKKEEG